MDITIYFKSSTLLFAFLWIHLVFSTENHATVQHDSVLRFQKYQDVSHSLDTFTKGQSLKYKQRYYDEQYSRTLQPSIKSPEELLGILPNGGKADEKHDDEDGSGCTKEMFGGDENAYLACITQYALQTNWFPSPIAGLYWG